MLELCAGAAPEAAEAACLDPYRRLLLVGLTETDLPAVAAMLEITAIGRGLEFKALERLCAAIAAESGTVSERLADLRPDGDAAFAAVAALHLGWPSGSESAPT